MGAKVSCCSVFTCVLLSILMLAFSLFQAALRFLSVLVMQFEYRSAVMRCSSPSLFLRKITFDKGRSISGFRLFDGYYKYQCKL